MKVPSGPMSGLKSQLSSYFNFDLRSVALFRVCIGISALVEILEFYAHDYDLLWGDHGIEQPRQDKLINLYSIVRSDAGMYEILFLIHALSATFLIMGLHAKPAAWITFLFQVSICGAAMGNAGDILLTNGLLISALLPTDQMWTCKLSETWQRNPINLSSHVFYIPLATSLVILMKCQIHLSLCFSLFLFILRLRLIPARVEEKADKVTFHITALTTRILLLSLYTFEVVIYKCKGGFTNSWITGEALYNSLSHPNTTYFGLFVRSLPSFILHIASWFAFAAEFLGPILILFGTPFIQMIGIVSLMSLHIGIDFCITIPAFCLTSFALLTVHIPSAFWNDVLLPRKIFFTGKLNIVLILISTVFLITVAVTGLVEIPINHFPQKFVYFLETCSLYTQWLMFWNPTDGLVSVKWAGRTMDDEVIDIVASWKAKEPVPFTWTIPSRHSEFETWLPTNRMIKYHRIIYEDHNAREQLLAKWALYIADKSPVRLKNVAIFTFTKNYVNNAWYNWMDEAYRDGATNWITAPSREEYRLANMNPPEQHPIPVEFALVGGITIGVITAVILLTYNQRASGARSKLYKPA